MKTQTAAVQFVFAGEVAQGRNVKLSELVEKDFFTGDLSNDIAAEDVYQLFTSEATDLAYDMIQNGYELGITSKFAKQKQAVVDAFNKLVANEISNIAKPFVQRRTVEGLADMKVCDAVKDYIASLTGKSIPKEEKKMVLSQDQLVEGMKALGLVRGGDCYTPAGKGLVEKFEATDKGVVVTVLVGSESKSFPVPQVSAKAPETVVATDPSKDKVKETEAAVRQARAQVQAAVEKPWEDMTEAERLAAHNEREDALADLRNQQAALKQEQASRLAGSNVAKRRLALNTKGGGAEAPKQEEKKEVQAPRRTMGLRGSQSSAAPAANQTKTNGGNVNMNQTANRQPSVRLGKGNFASTGEQASAPAANRGNLRLKHDAVESREYTRFEGPWYLNRNWYPNVMAPEAFAEARKNEELGITGFRMLNPTDVFENAPASMLAIFEVSFGMGVKFEFSIFESNQADSKEPIYSPNVGFNSFVGRNGRTVYQRLYRFSAPVRNEEGRIEGYDNINVSRGMKMDENVFAQIMTLAHWALGYEIESAE